MISKEKILESIAAMPEDKFDDIDVLLERILMLEKIETGIQQIKDGQTVPHIETGKIIDSWFTK